MADSTQALVAVFLQARHRLFDTIANPSTGAGTKTYANTVLQQLDREIAHLQATTGSFVSKTVPMQYVQGLNETYAYFQRHGLQMRHPDHFAVLHRDAMYDISREMQHNIGSALIDVGRQVQRYVDAAQADTLRRIGLEQTAVKMASGATVWEMRNAMLRQMQQHGFMTIQYGEGRSARQVPLDVYATMVARTTTREAGNAARVNQLTANGYDHMKMSEHFPTCPICAPLQGRVYSISGNDQRFSSIDVAWSSGYKTVHPNCIHVFTPWIAELRSDDEIKQESERSKAPFEDTRGEKERELYAAHQAKNRQARQELYQFERYKARLGNDAPKTLAEFRRVKRAGGERWEALQAEYRKRGVDNSAKTRYNERVAADTNAREYHPSMDGTLSNAEAREWYVDKLREIPAQIDRNLPLEEQARQAYTLRNLYRTQARDLMGDTATRTKLDVENPNPTFEELISHKMRKYGFSREEALEDILRSASVENKRVNRQLGV